MLLQTNSYVVPKERRSEHARLLRRFKQVLHKLGCDNFEVYEQAGTNWTSDQNSGRFVQIMRFRDRKQQMAVQAAERDDPTAQAVIAEFCELINFPYQQQQGLFAIGYYTSILSSGKLLESPADHAPAPPPEPAAAMAGAMGEQMTMVVDRETLAESVAEHEPNHDAAPIRNPFAEAPIVAGAAEEPAASRNGDGHSSAVAGDESAVDEEMGGESRVEEIEEPLPHAAVDDLDALIRQHFGGAGSRSENGEVIGDAATLPPEAENTLPGSGIGAVLDASLQNDDPDLDIALPAELLEQPESSGAHGSDSMRRHEDHGRE